MVVLTDRKGINNVLKYQIFQIKVSANTNFAPKKVFANTKRSIEKCVKILNEGEK